MRHFLKALSFVVSLLPATLCAAEIRGKVIRVLDGDTIEVKTLPAKIDGYMNVTTRMSHYRLCNGKRRNKNAVCGPTQIRFHRGSGDTNITN